MTVMIWICTLVVMLFLFLSLDSTVFAVDNPEDFVNLLAGTFTDGDRFSTGM